MIESAYASALFDRDIDAALQYVEAVRRHDPANAGARMLLVFLPLMRGQTVAALNAARRAGGSLAGSALYFARAYTQAIPYFEASAAENPGARVMLGACKLFAGDAQGAIADFRAVYGEHVDVRRAGRPNVRHYALALSIYAMGKSGDRVRVSSMRGKMEVLALVTKRLGPITVDGKKVYQVGIPIHWGFVGLTKGDHWLANALTPFVGDANSRTPEFKAFLVKVEKM